jgi:peptidoglycan/LPS O-acetylase OafA/YrhL
MSPDSGPGITEGSATARGPRPRFPLFDSLRAIAALSIFGFHIAASQGELNDPDFPWLGQLNVGVPIFFVVSGFLLYRPFVAARLRGDAPPAVVSYAIRRVLRIVPAYWMALPLIALWLGRGDEVFTLTGVITYFGFLQLYDVSTIAGGIGQAWTLGVEVSFYVFLPVWAFLVRRLPGELRPLAALALVGIVWKIVVLVTAFNAGSSAAFPLLIALPAWLETFAGGMALAVLSVWVTDRGWRAGWVRVVEERPWVPWLIALLAFVAVGPHGWQGGNESQVMIEYELKTVIAIGLVMPAVFGEPTRGWVRRVLAFPPLLWVGLVSYGFYLWHLAVIEKLKDGGWDDKLGLPLFVVVALGGSLAIAAASWYCVERPALRLGRRLTGPTAQTRTLADDRAALESGGSS